jgi:nucleoside phosphorylase
MSRAVILTALSVEYLAVRAHLTNLREDTHPNGTIYERGSFSAGSLVWDVGIVEIGAGNTGAALEAERAIAYFSPNIVLFVGVAGGIKDVAIGDVVASTKIYGYESGKAEQRFKPRPDIGLPSYSLEQRAKAEARKEDWLQRLANFPNPTPRVFVAPIAAGEKVMASTQSDVFQFLSENYGDAIAIEMEGLGFLEAARANQHVSAMVIRGISDLIDGKGKSDRSGSQETASRHASAFAFEVLAKSKFQDALPPTIHPESSGIIQQNSANAQGWQVVVQGGTAYIGNIHIHEEPKDIELTGIPCNIIQRGTTTFVGRDVDLDTLHTQLQQDQKIAIFAIIGMGGIGKTELALQYALRHQGLSTYTSSVCWLKAREEIGTQIVLFARTRLGLDPPEDLGLAGKVAWCWQRWNKGNALILFDDVQDYSNIELFLPPPESRFKVLITTRSRLGSPVQNYEIKVLSERQSLELLRKIGSAFM